MKPTSSFKLSKTSKRFLSTIVDPHRRGEAKRMAIQGELAAAAAKFAKVDKSSKE